jgi:hypothetical protein
MHGAQIRLLASERTDWNQNYLVPKPLPFWVCLCLEFAS